MTIQEKITALRMERQHLHRQATPEEYADLYRDLGPGYNVYWNGFGDPPTLTHRAGFDDMEYNRARQAERKLIKGRFNGGNLGWVTPDEVELYACAFNKPLDKPNERHSILLQLIALEGTITIQDMKKKTGLLVKEITPALHRLQEAFLVHEDQRGNEDDRGWCLFSEAFPDVSLGRYTKTEAISILMRRFAFRNVWFDLEMAKSFYKLPAKELKAALDMLLAGGVISGLEGGYVLSDDIDVITAHETPPTISVYAMHRNDFLVRSNEHALKDKYPNPYPDLMYYLLIDGVFRGAVVGKFRYTPELEDVVLDLPRDECAARKSEIINAVELLSDGIAPARFMGEYIV